MFIGIGLPLTAFTARAPSWVLRTAGGDLAALDADFENGRYWGANRAFSAEAAFLTAIGGTGADGAYVVGPYVDPTNTNVLTNGSFEADVTGWAAAVGSLAWSDGEAELTLANGSYSNIGQALTNAGHAYLVTGTGRRGTTANGFWLFAGVQAGMTGGSAISPSSQNIDSASDKTASGLCSVSLNPTYIGFRSSSATASGTALFDDISAVEAWPFVGWTPDAFSVAITATTPASISADETLWQADATTPGAQSTEKDRVRIYRKAADNHIIVETVYAVATSVSIDLGAVAEGEQFSLAASFETNNVSASLNGGAPVTDTSAVIPGCAIMRLGQKYSGGTWGGTIERMTVF